MHGTSGGNKLPFFVEVSQKMQSHIQNKYKNHNSQSPKEYILGFDFEESDTRLKPCPFCGSEKVLIYISGQEWKGKKSIPDSIEYMYGVQCISCGMGYIGQLKTREDALKAWNNRV